MQNTLLSKIEIYIGFHLYLSSLELCVRGGLTICSRMGIWEETFFDGQSIGIRYLFFFHLRLEANGEWSRFDKFYDRGWIFIDIHQ